MNRPLHHITRIDSGGTRGWWVRFTWKGRVHPQKFFGDKSHGGTKTALTEAKKWRDAQLSNRPVRTPQTGKHLVGRYHARLRTNNTSGQTGVHPRLNKAGEIIAWCATWTEPGKRPCRREFFLSTHGNRAYNRAVAFRRKKEKECYTGPVGKENR